MNRLDRTRKAGKLLAGASLALGMWISPISDILAAERPYRPYCPCPPGYASPSSPYYAPAPGVPTPARPGDATSPSDMGMGDMGTGMGDQAQQQQQQDQAQQPTDFTPSPDSSGRASLAPGANTPQLGRLDQANRLNLFDNMVAAPQNKVWFGFQYSSGINTGLGGSSEFNSFFTGLTPADQAIFNSALGGTFAEQRQINYRAGAEVMVTTDTSIAFQGQYFTNETDGEFSDDFSNPQILIKHVLARDCDTILSATLGITPQTSIEQGDFDENTTKFYPGMLYYETLSPTLFTQGGFQFGLPVRDDQITTFDWSLSLGYWLYQDCSLQSGCCCNSGRITGIIPQVNLLGKHTLGSETRANAFGFNSATPVGGFDPDLGGPAPAFMGSTLFLYTEPEHVLDLSVGTLILVGSDVQVGMGYSFPITEDETRESEFLSYVNYLF